MAALVVVLLLSGCTQQSTPTAPSKTTCPAKYMSIGNGCCPDLNGNGICDNDEPAPKQNSDLNPPQNASIEDRVKECKLDSYCLFRLAMETDNVGVCSAILISGPITVQCIQSLAARDKAPGYCSQLYGDDQKNCLAMINSTSASSPAAFAPVANAPSPAAKPPAQVNATFNDRTGECVAAQPGDHDNCFKKLAVDMKSSYFCTILYTTINKYDCLTEMAVRYHDKRYCNEIIDTASSSWCKSQVVEAVN